MPVKELLPCPFCGATASYQTEPCEPLTETDSDSLGFIECNHCGARGPVVDGKERHKADAGWDTRYDLIPKTKEETEDFENWLRTVCFQKPTPEAHDLAKCAWIEARSDLRAKLDALMLEHCPDEMSAEQKARWAENQRPLKEQEK